MLMTTRNLRRISTISIEKQDMVTSIKEISGVNFESFQLPWINDECS